MTELVEHDDSRAIAASGLRSSTRVIEPEEGDIREAAFEDSEHGGSPMGEHIMQRLRYFENLSEHQAAHIRTLGALMVTHGGAVPKLPHFAPLKSPLGNHDPNDHT
jgi:hypothetical protein